MIGENFPAVLAAARSKADWAWTELYRDLAPVVLGYLRAQGAAEPQDLTGEVFLQVVKSLNQFEGEEPAFRAWVFVIAHRKMLDERRYNIRRPVEPAEVEKIEAGAATGDAQEEAMQSLGDERVREVLQTLTPDQRDVLLLRVIAGLTLSQAAAAMGKRPGAIKALQQRGLAQLRQKVASKAVSI